MPTLQRLEGVAGLRAVGSLSSPGSEAGSISYQSGIRRAQVWAALPPELHPLAFYLHTDLACPVWRRSVAEGNALKELEPWAVSNSIKLSTVLCA